MNIFGVARREREPMSSNVAWNGDVCTILNPNAVFGRSDYERNLGNNSELRELRSIQFINERLVGLITQHVLNHGVYENKHITDFRFEVAGVPPDNKLFQIQDNWQKYVSALKLYGKELVSSQQHNNRTQQPISQQHIQIHPEAKFVASALTSTSQPQSIDKQLISIYQINHSRLVKVNKQRIQIEKELSEVKAMRDQMQGELNLKKKDSRDFILLTRQISDLNRRLVNGDSLLQETVLQESRLTDEVTANEQQLAEAHPK